MAKRILFVDDDRRFVNPYAEELVRRGHAVQIAATIDDGLLQLRNHGSDTWLVVWDMMMPSGTAFKDRETKGGLRTGHFFYEELKKLHPDMRTILFTNANLELLTGPFRTDKQCLSFMKEDLLPGELADLLETLLRAGQAGSAQGT